LRGACAQRLRDVGDLRPVLLVVVGIAAAHVTATQLTTECLRHSERLTTPLLLWASTCSNLLLGAPLLAWRARARGGAKPLLGAWDARPRQLALAVAPFFVLYLGANGLYIAALASLSPPLVVSIFSTTPALVALLSVPLLGRPLRALAVAAVACSTVGVVLVAQPWAAGGRASSLNSTSAEAASGEGGAAGLGAAAAASVAGAAGCEALYKVLFRRLFGDVPPPALLFFLVTLGGCGPLVAEHLS